MKKQVFTGTEWEKKAGYCRAVRVGSTIEVAGTTAMKDGKPYGVGNAFEQARYILQTIEEALTQLGSGMKDVVRTRMYVTDITNWEEVARAHALYFEKVRPAATLVQVQQLVHKDLLVEIEVQAIDQNPMRLV